VWVVAPPFEIIDVALGNQLFSHGEEALVPQSLVLEEPRRVVAHAADYCSMAALRKIAKHGGPVRSWTFTSGTLPGLARTTAFFPSFDVDLEQATLRYAMGGVMVSDAPSLYAITSRRWNGRLPGELFDDLVRPALSVVS
jgi:hypothetical protein